ncbi:hypothetical protein FS837_009141 [Tulasnella sp. UAMH 9824]|nr:hypothetical protein FS837_009141 [Tulasnella sp. UAMH 9824]
MKTLATLSALSITPAALSTAIYEQCGGITGITSTCDSGRLPPPRHRRVPQTYSSTTKTSSSTTKTSTTTTKPTTTTKTTVTAAPTGLTTTLPASSGYISFASVSTITGTFDGHMYKYDRKGSDGESQEQIETGEAIAVFILESGATIQNVAIGKDQAEGIHCKGPCTLINVWWEDVCEDALTIEQTGASDISYVIGGGTFHAEDKIIQHNRAGTVNVKNFFASDFGKVYRTCGNCSKMYERHVIMDNVGMHDGSTGVGVNENYGDTATLTNICTNGDPSDSNVCCRYTGVSPGSEPPEIGCGPSGNTCN